MSSPTIKRSSCLCYSWKKLIDITARMLQQTTRYEFMEPHNQAVAKAVWDPIAALHTTADAKRYALHPLPVVVGESGSGKTMLALCPPAGVPELITLYFNGFKSKCLPDSVDDLPACDENIEMEQAFSREVAGHVVKHLLRDRSPPADGATSLRLNLVFDEMGTRRAELRLLCRLRSSICEAVRAACNAATVSMMAVGTGANAVGSGAGVGSAIGSFAVLTLRNDPCVWHHHLEEAEKEADACRASRQLKATLNEVAQLNIVRQLAGNPRAARVLCMELTGPITCSGDWDALVLGSCVDRCIVSVAHTYRALNALSSLPHDELRMHCADALRYAMCPSTQPSPVDVPELDLVHTYGLLIDLSEVVAAGGEEDPAFDYLPSSDGSTVVRVPKRGRFELSPAMGVMAAVFVGAFRPSALSSSRFGEELALVVAMKAALVLTCVRTVAEAHEAMGFDQAVGYDAADKKSLRREIRVAGECDGEVVVHRCIHRLGAPSEPQGKAPKAEPVSEGAKEEVESIRDALRQTSPAGNPRATAVVAISAHGAPHASVTVVAPGLLWFLRVDAASKGRSAATQVAELGWPRAELLKVAGCRQAMLGLVGRTPPSTSTRGLQPDRGLCVATLDAARALMPFRAPERSAFRLGPGIPAVRRGSEVQSQ